MGLFSWLTGGGGKARKLLEEYGVDLFTHAGAPGALSAEQRIENLAAFRSSIETRIARFRRLAGALGCVLPEPNGDRSRIDGVAQKLDRLCKEQLLNLVEVEEALAGDWRENQPQGFNCQVQTLAIDLGTYCGQTGIACADHYQWVVDDKRYTARSRMRTSGRIAIGYDPDQRDQPINTYVDVMDIAAFALTDIVRQRKHKTLWRPNYFHFLSDLADGRYT